MLSDSREDYTGITTKLRRYTVYKSYELPIANDGMLLEQPTNKCYYLGIRGGFMDCAENYWSVSTHKQ